jgi:hypothetical protein
LWYEIDERRLLNKPAGMPWPSEEQILKTLEDAGCTLIVKGGLYNKSLAKCERMPDNMQLYGIFWIESKNPH